MGIVRATFRSKNHQGHGWLSQGRSRSWFKANVVSDAGKPGPGAVNGGSTAGGGDDAKGVARRRSWARGVVFRAALRGLVSQWPGPLHQRQGKPVPVLTGRTAPRDPDWSRGRATSGPSPKYGSSGPKELPRMRKKEFQEGKIVRANPSGTKQTRKNVCRTD